ncbi:MAG TPA: hypothetical protein EYG86_03745, partial [Crocinitomicaceae bacterium]|nr:hypothetical protein [Crocinitomicaceae bacterium]
MKNNLENSIKESLEQFEAPYNPNAWTAMSSKLDKVMPASSTGGSFKWIAAASVIAVATISSYIIFKKDAAPIKTEQISENTARDNTTKTEKVTTPQKTSQVTSNEALTNETSREISNEENISADLNKSNAETIDIQDFMEETTPNQIKIVETNPSHKNTTETNETKFQIPLISEVCVGEKIHIDNTNNVDLNLSGIGKDMIIPSNTGVDVILYKSGKYQLSSEASTETSTFYVKALPKVDFSIDQDNKFKDGLPTTTLSSISGSNLTWIINTNEYKGQKVNAHFFKKGMQTIELYSKGSNGCSNSIQKEFYNENQYNLMSVNSFRPNNNDPRLNTFMPYALTQRDVNFNLIIMD